MMTWCLLLIPVVYQTSFHTGPSVLCFYPALETRLPVEYTPCTKPKSILLNYFVFIIECASTINLLLILVVYWLRVSRGPSVLYFYPALEGQNTRLLVKHTPCTKPKFNKLFVFMIDFEYYYRCLSSINRFIPDLLFILH